MNDHPPLEPGSFYHIYNRGINGEPIFHCNDNYQYFLSLYDKHVDCVVDTYAWCLLGNHFHLLVKVKEGDEIRRNLKLKTNLTGFQNLSGLVSKKFSNLFNAYSKAFNKKYDRHGSLFERPFRRIQVNTDEYLRQLVYYIHFNPVKHGFVNNMLDYPWSSYLSIISIKPTKLMREKVIGWFNSESDFIEYHEEKQLVDLIKYSLLED